MASPKIKIASAPGGAKLKLVMALFALVGVAILYASFTVEVPPDARAVRQVYLGPDKGIQNEVLDTGLHFVIPGYEQLHLFPKTMQILELNDDKTSGVARAAHRDSIRIQTSEGYQVKVDVTVAYRVLDPYKVITSVGPGKLYETSLVGPRSDTILRQTLGKLNAEQFYDGTARQTAAASAFKLLTEDLAHNGIQVWSVMVRHYTYDARYQELIEQRKIQDQMVFKNQAEAVAASREAEKKRVLAEGQASVEVEKERGRSDVRKIQAEGDLYYREKIANGDLLVALAEAEGTRLENAALQVAGASNVVGLEMAEVLEGVKVIIVPTDGQGGVNPLNLNSLLGGW
jgi:regulator of protease activity HflC (stomatin/prohibitin superfamily)